MHAGSTVAMCPPKVALDEGGCYEASKAQRWLWQGWQDYWKQIAAKRDALGADLYCVFNGDMVDGQPHQTTQIISANPNAQAAVVNAAMSVPLALQPDRIFVVRGTEAHVGKSAAAEERIADGLRRDKRPVEGDPDSGTASWWHLRMEVQGVRLDIAHHGRTGQREHTRGSAAILHAHDIYLSHCKRGDPPPHLALRGHYHRFNDSYDSCPTRAVTTGAWQLKTSYVHKVAADSMADIGGVCIVIEKGAYALHKIEFVAEARGAVWRA